MTGGIPILGNHAQKKEICRDTMPIWGYHVYMYTYIYIIIYDMIIKNTFPLHFLFGCNLLYLYTYLPCHFAIGSIAAWHLFAQAEDFLPPLILHEVQALDDPVETSTARCSVATPWGFFWGEPTKRAVMLKDVYNMFIICL